MGSFTTVGIGLRRFRILTASLLAFFPLFALQAQLPDEPSVIRGIDDAVHARLEGIAGYTVTEHYAVYRNNENSQPMAEMTVKTTYSKESGKSYAILSESGTEIIRRLVLGSILENEQHINLPGVREGSWITSANYEMHVKPGGIQSLDGRNCLAVAITPRRKATNLIEGTLWVDAKDYSIARIDGVFSKSPTLWSGPAHVMRQYANVNSFAEATHARAVSDSFLFGQIIVTIDYRDYQVQLRTDK